MQDVEQKVLNIGEMRLARGPKRFSSELLQRRIQTYLDKNQKIVMGTPIERHYFDTPELLPIIINKVVSGLENAVVLNPLITENKFSLKQILDVLDVSQMSDEVRVKAYFGLLLHDEVEIIIDSKQEYIRWFAVKPKEATVEKFESLLKALKEFD